MYWDTSEFVFVVLTMRTFSVSTGLLRNKHPHAAGTFTLSESTSYRHGLGIFQNPLESSVVLLCLTEFDQVLPS